MIKFVCECGKKMQTPDNLAGKLGRCPECGATFRIPEAEPPMIPDVVDIPLLEDDGPPLVDDPGVPMVAEPESPGGRKKPKGPKKRGGSLAQRQRAKAPEGMGCIATLDYINAAQSFLFGILLLWFGSALMEVDGGMGGFVMFLGVLCLGLGVFMLILVSNYMALKRWAITTRIVLAVIGLLQFPAGTLINIYVLVVLSQAQSAGSAKRRMQASGGGRKKPRRRRR